MSISKILAVTFLSLAAILFLVISIALSPIGVNLLVSYANQQQGITIEDHSGSFYSAIKFGRIEVDLPTVKANVYSTVLETEIGCLFEAELCIAELAAESVEVNLLATEAPEETADTSSPSEYIELPIPMYLNQFSLGNLVLYQGDMRFLEQF